MNSNASVIPINSGNAANSVTVPAILSILRALAVVFFGPVALIELPLRLLFVRQNQHAFTRARWLNGWCRFACRVLGVHVHSVGKIPESGLIVSNHLSYLDIIALSSLRPCVFVAKRDVASWPLFGWLARSAGTIFADRERKLACGGVVDQMRDAIGRGALLVLFPEGTSSDGATVLPFKSALLEPATLLGCPITTAAIDYSLTDGSVADEVCYWRDMTLVPHMLNLFSKCSVDAVLTFKPYGARVEDRKQLARDLRTQIIEIRS